MTGAELRTYLRRIIPVELLLALAREYGVVERERQLDIERLVTALLMSGGTHEGGRQYDVLRLYLESGARRVVRGAFYAWFNEPLERLLVELLRRAIDAGQDQRKLLRGILGGVSDWRVFDSSTVKLPKELLEEYPGAGEYAAVKVHKEWSVGTGNLVAYTLSPAREHDSPFLVVDESRRGTGLLMDLGYASIARLADCERHDVRYVMRLKNNWKPTVNRLVRGAITREVSDGEDFDVLLNDDVLDLRGGSVDADVTVGRGAQSVRSRLVGIPTAKGYCFFLTNLPRKTHGPKQVGEVYRVRWEIEIDFKADKSGARLDEISARKGVSVRILLLASLLNATIARTIVQSEKLAIRRERTKAGNATRAPLHPILVMRALSATHGTIAELLLDDRSRETDWNSLMGLLRHLGHDPNWRNRPSVLDRIQGMTAPPGRRRNARAATARIHA